MTAEPGHDSRSGDAIVVALAEGMKHEEAQATGTDSAQIDEPAASTVERCILPEVNEPQDARKDASAWADFSKLLPTPASLAFWRALSDENAAESKTPGFPKKKPSFAEAASEGDLVGVIGFEPTVWGFRNSGKTRQLRAVATFEAISQDFSKNLVFLYHGTGNGLDWCPPSF